ncbi:probable 3-hydroxyisobutyrate dehydrogenase, mitochondrial [Primulina huaijiensis]|uniref:probable 3-hydroxyisobutyrate dehydrogenase, mitochondrial n=1 Tax=Primulina huaijiensis TaxID=1492673 RepID=UPI003CC73AA3
MDVYTGPKGFLSDGNLLRPQLFIDSSTIDPETSRTVSKVISGCKLKEDRGSSGTPAMLDPPVSGCVLSAETGSFTFMVDGSEQAYMTSKPLLLSMGKNINTVVVQEMVWYGLACNLVLIDTYNPVPGVMDEVPVLGIMKAALLPN